MLTIQDKKNEWLKIEAEIDFRPVEAACRQYHKRESGKNVPHHVGRLVRALYVKYYRGLSLRETEQEIRYNMAVKWFVGYGLHERPCDHSTLDRFEQWVEANEPRIYFDAVLKDVDKRYGKQEREKIQFADTYAMEAAAAKQSLIGVLRQTSEKLIAAAAVANGQDEGVLWGQIDTIGLLGKPKERHWCHLNEAERQTRLFQTVRGAVACQRVVEHLPQSDAATNERMRQLKKILADEVAIETNEAGEVVTVKRLAKEKRGSYRIISAVDAEATFREHGKGKSTFGYNISVSTTDEFVREIRADTGATPDSQPIPALLEAQQAHHGFVPAKLVYDQATGDGKTMERVDKATDGKTQLVAQMRDYGKRSKLFTPSDFHYDAANFELSCPGGVTSTRFYRHGTKSGWSVRFLREKDGCATCPLLQQCYKFPATQKTRNVFISDPFIYFVAAVLYMTSEDFRHEMRQRAHVERIIAALVRHNDSRRARRRGTAAADFQVKMAAAVYNTKKLLRKIEDDPPLG